MIQQSYLSEKNKITEADFVDKISILLERECSLFQYNSNTKRTMLHEVNVGYGIADIVYSEYEDDIVRNHTLDKGSLIILQLIERKQQLDIEQLLQTTSISKRNLNKKLSILMEDGFISCSDNIIRIKKPYKNKVDTTIAIEAKIKNWQRALKQAYRYQAFAHYSYVCLYEDYCAPAIKNIERFKELNVGLIISNGTKLEFIQRPQRDIPFASVMNSLLYEQILESSNTYCPQE